MSINRDNYEEYFLLYADNELTDSEKAEVLMFVKNNKDLEQEFRMIHRAVMKPEADVKFDNKNSLLKNTCWINDKNYEEAFILYHDNELNEKERMQTEEFLSLHKELKSEFELIGLARFTAEANDTFNHKNLLYKKEKTAKVVPIIIRMLAAAAFVSFVFWRIDIYWTKPAIPGKPVAHNISSKKPPVNNDIIKHKTDTSKEIARSDYSKKTVNTTSYEKAAHKLLQQKAANHLLASANIKGIKASAKNVKVSPAAKINVGEVASGAEIKSIAAAQIITSQMIGTTSLAMPGKLTESSTEAPAAGIPRTASYIENAHIKNSNYVFYDVSADEFKRTKVGGFFKKIRRVIVRSNPIGRLLSGDERQVAAK